MRGGLCKGAEDVFEISGSQGMFVFDCGAMQLLATFQHSRHK
jgi:hypothetical protein